MTAIATPVFAQAAIQEPGAFAFYHPNADVLAGRYRRFVRSIGNAYYNSNAYHSERRAGRAAASSHRRDSAEAIPSCNSGVQMSLSPALHYFASSKIIAAPFSAIIAVGVLVLPDVIVGITEASATRKPAMP